MIVGVRGVLEATGPDWVHLQVGGITLQIFVPSSAIGGLGPTGGQVRLFTHLRIRDDHPVLYGFPTNTASELFLVLMGVSGVGPRHSLSLLSALGVDGLQQAITNGDVAVLSNVHGVGRRTAGRLVLELKGKLDIQPSGEDAAAPGIDDAEVIAALTALGYSNAEARRAVNDLDKSPDLTLEDRIRQALQRMGGGG